MKYFVAPGEDRVLDATVRTRLRGSYIRLSDGVTHYELAGLSERPASQKLLLGNDFTGTLIAKRLGRRIFDRHQGHNVREPQRAEALATMVGDAYHYDGSLFAFFDTLQHFPLFDRAELYRQTSTDSVPTMSMWGTADEVTPISNLARVRSLLRPEQCHVIDDCGHMVPFERPADVAAHVASFTASHR